MKRGDHHITVNGEEWLLRIRPLRGRAAGWCYHDDRKILVDSRLRGVALLETIIHEILHAAVKPLSEEAVEQTAYDAARALATLGYREHDERD